MYGLAIDTATNAGGVALSRNAEIVGLIMLKTPLRYSDNLIPMVSFLLSEHSLTLPEIGWLSVATGPGSFTGLRIGIAIAKAFGQGTGIPAVGVSTLEALAYEHRHIHPRLVPFVDARRQQVFAAAYHAGGDQLEAVSPEEVTAPAAWLHRFQGEDYLYVGDGAQLYRTTVEALKPGSRVLVSDNCLLRSLSSLGFQRFSRGKSVPVDELRANYVRPADAKLSDVPGTAEVR